MRAFSLQSGSNGNSIFVESGGVRLLFDAGLSGVEAQRRLARHNVDIRSITALLISHDHSDHIRSAGVFARKFGIPVWITRKTHSASAARGGPGKIPRLEHFEAGDILSFGDVRIETYATPHDGVDGVVFVVTDGQKRLGVMTDLGHVFVGLEGLVAGLDAVFLESNYDDAMLMNGPYPPVLKKRISGEGGHISNRECASLLLGAFSVRMRWACLSHLSEVNNNPAVAMRTARQILGEVPTLHVAGRYDVSPVLEL